MPESLERIISIILENVTWVIFAIFMLSGLFSRSGGKKTTSSDPIQPVPREKNTDNRPLAERMAEHFGIPLEDVQGTGGSQQAQTQQRPRQQNTARGRRSTTIGNTQDNYPELYGNGSGKSIWDEEPADDRWGSSQKWGSSNQQWGFDETEWGSTFEKNDEQWGGGFAEKKDSTPRIEIG